MARSCLTCGTPDLDVNALRCRPHAIEHKRQQNRDYNLRHRDYLRAKTNTRRREDPESYRKRQATNYKSRMGITIEERDSMLAAQGGVCAICKSSDPNGPTWCTDHDHACCPDKMKVCGKCIRGILCFRCNTLLGHAKDSIQTLENAIEFLTEWEARNGR